MRFEVHFGPKALHFNPVKTGCETLFVLIVVRPADARYYERRRAKQEVWHTFDPGEPLTLGFGCLQTVREVRLPPQASVKELVGPASILTYVREGAVAFSDTMGRSGTVSAGEFQRMTAGDAISKAHRLRPATRRAFRDPAHRYEIRHRSKAPVARA